MKRASILLGILLCATLVRGQSNVADKFYQELDVQRAPTFDVQGLQIAQEMHYQILSLFTVHEPDELRRRKVTQEIRSTRLVKSDTFSKMIFPKALEALNGKTIVFVFDERGEVVDFQGVGPAPQVDRVPIPGADGLFVTKVIDDDGWKELAKFTLFKPAKERADDGTFKYATRHDWGDLGSWYGDTVVKPDQKRGNIERFRFNHELEYVPPEAKQGQELPFEVNKAEFQAYRADGEIYYDHRSERISQATEWFMARGTVKAQVLGNEVQVNVQEQQKMSIRLKSEKFRVR